MSKGTLYDNIHALVDVMGIISMDAKKNNTSLNHVFQSVSFILQLLLLQTKNKHTKKCMHFLNIRDRNRA